MGRLYCSENKKLAGVCAGIAESFNLNVSLVRMLFVILLLASFGAALVAYIILWAVMPVNKRSHKNYEERLRERLGK